MKRIGTTKLCSQPTKCYTCISKPIFPQPGNIDKISFEYIFFIVGTYLGSNFVYIQSFPITLSKNPLKR